MVSKKIFKVFPIIGIKHVFLCINICWTRRVVWKPEPQGEVLTTTKGSSDVNVSENHVMSLSLHKVILSLENFGKKASKRSFFVLL